MKKQTQWVVAGFERRETHMQIPVVLAHRISSSTTHKLSGLVSVASRLPLYSLGLFLFLWAHAKGTQSHQLSFRQPQGFVRCHMKVYRCWGHWLHWCQNSCNVWRPAAGPTSVIRVAVHNTYILSAHMTNTICTQYIPCTSDLCLSVVSVVQGACWRQFAPRVVLSIWFCRSHASTYSNFYNDLGKLLWAHTRSSSSIRWS